MTSAPLDLPMPGWAAEFREKFSAGLAHTFILHGAVEDYVGDQRTRLDDYLASLLGETRVVVFYNCSRGIHFVAPKHRSRFLAALGEDPNSVPALHENWMIEAFKALQVIDKVLHHPDMVGQLSVVFEYPELIWPNAAYGQLGERDRINLATMRRWATSSDMVGAQQVLMMLTPVAYDLHSSLLSSSSGIETVEIPYPDQAEREAFITSRMEADAYTLSDDLTTHSFANLTGGLSRVLVDDIILRSAILKQPVDLRLIRDRKDQIIRQEYGEVIEILEPRHGFDAVGGMEEIKQYLTNSVILPLLGKGRPERIPSGVMLAGPPGTGKTFLVSALAKEAGVNVVKLNAGRLLGKYVGTSERNLEKALACIRSLSPTLVMIDEIEQQFQRGSGNDGGVERRIFGRILEEMSGASGTKRGDVVWFAATNRLDLVDPALRRPGRFDRIIPVLAPSNKERWEIIKTKLPAGTKIESQEQARRIVEASAHYTGADLDGVILKASELALDESGMQSASNRAPSDPAEPGLTGAHLLEALELLRPSSSGSAVEMMTDQALLNCNDLSLVPPAWREHAKRLDEAALDGQA